MNLFYFTKQAPARLFAALALFSLVAGLLPMQAFAQGAPVKEFDASVNPGSINAGATAGFSFTISNEPVSGANIKAARIVIPAGFAGANLSVNNSQFETAFVGTEIRVSLKPGTGNDGLIPGASMIVSVDLTNNSGSGNSAWEVCAYKNNSFTPASGADFEFVGGGDCASLGISIVAPPVLGCTNPLATNFNPLATVDDGSCIVVTPVPGCTNPDAFNYNPAATVDNGSCIPKVLGCTDPLANNHDADANVNDGSCTYDVEGCTNPAATNYNPVANVDDGSCTVPVTGCTNPLALNHNPNATVDDGSCVLPVEGCTDPLANNYDDDANVNDGSCTYDVRGCTNPLANNYNQAANIDDGSCDFDPDPVPGCTNPDAFNYNPAATVDNGSCIPKVLGCTDPLADNYNQSANVDNGTCDFGDNDPDPVACTVEIVSNTSDFVVENDDNAKLVTFIHDAWDAVVSGASWIWGDDPVADPVGTTTQTFQKNFGFVGTVDSAKLYVASDNSHSASVNGNAPFNGGSTFAAAVEYDVTAQIAQGNNELEFVVTNEALVGGTTTSNPAGLMYKLVIEGEVTSDADCSVPYVPPTPPVELYRIQGYVWHDDNQNETWDGNPNDEEMSEETPEDSLSGWTVRITDGKGDNRSTTTDEFGFYYFDVPAGTWTITEDVQDDWEQIVPDESYVVTVPEEDDEEMGFLNTVMNFIIPTAYAAVAGPAPLSVYGNYNFGNDQTPGRSGGGGGGGNRAGDRDGRVLGDSDTVEPTPLVLGEQVSAVPTGAPDAGAGGTSSRSLEFFQVAPVALVGRTRKHG